MSELRIAFAGDREISVRALDFLIERGAHPAALMVSGPDRASHAKELILRCGISILQMCCARLFGDAPGVEALKSLALDLVCRFTSPTSCLPMYSESRDSAG